MVNSSLLFPLTTGGSLDLSWDHTNEETTNQFAAFDVSTTDVLTVALTQPLLRRAWRRYATAQQKESELLLALASVEAGDTPSIAAAKLLSAAALTVSP